MLSVAVESTLEDCVFDELENIVFVVCVMSTSCLCGCYILLKKIGTLLFGFLYAKLNQWTVFHVRTVFLLSGLRSLK